MRILQVILFFLMSQMAFSMSNGETGVLIRPIVLVEDPNSGNAYPFTPVVVCSDDYFLAKEQLKQDEQVFLYYSEDEFQEIVLIGETLMVDSYQIIIPVVCFDRD